MLAVVADPPEVAPGDILRLDVWVADPAAQAVDVLVAVCTPLGGRCVESLGGTLGVSAYTRTASVPAGDPVAGGSEPWRVALLVPPALEEVVGPGGATATFLVWAMACAPGACPWIDAIRAAGDEPDDAVEATLADLEMAVRDLPMDDAALSLRRLVVSGRPPAERNAPPTLLRVGTSPLGAPPGGSFVLTFTGGDLTYVWPYATAGGFEFERYGMAGGSTAMRWTAPDAPGEARLWVVGEDGLGGSVVWTERVEVR